MKNKQIFCLVLLVCSFISVSLAQSKIGNDDDDLDIPKYLQDKMSSNGYEPTNLKEEESKMNENDTESNLSESEEKRIAAELLNAANDRMNTEERLNGNEMTGSVVVSEFSSFESQPSVGQQNKIQYSQDKTMNSQQSDSFHEENDDASSGDNAMNGGESVQNKVPQKLTHHESSFESMNAVSEGHDDAMSLMNAIKSKPTDIPSANIVPPTQTVTELPKNEKVNQEQQQPQQPQQEQQKEQKEQEKKLSTPEMEKPNENNKNEMNQSPLQPAFMPSTTKAKMSEGDSSVIPKIVPESTGEKMDNDVEIKIISKKQNENENEKIKTVYKAPKDMKIFESEETIMENKMNGIDNGDQMAKVSKSSTSSSAEVPGFMDAPTHEEKEFESQMNTINKKGLDMMSTVASFLESQANYNQYMPQMRQPLPFGHPGLLPFPTHPYGLPYFHKDPFSPLQTPYYHIPAFDNPKRNLALTPYANPFVNPPPPVPPTVPAAPSFFPFHHPQHMIPPYYPYPLAPVLQAAPFAPYSLPSYIEPGKLAPTAKFAKLPEKVKDDPF